MIKNFDVTKIKLVIWDLDETFWNGTLTESEVEFNQENLILLENLVLKGIMNSICSKNNFAQVKEKFETLGYKKFWDLFVFSSIEQTPKGQRIKNIISEMNLREENVLVFDDNISNLNEIKFFCPDIMTATPEYIEILSKELYLVNTYDFHYKRLNQYKLLEQKCQDKISLNCSNEEFLRNSDIKLCIKKDCKENLDRIDTLIHRTNQLNFTKNRVSKEDLENYFDDTETFDSAYVIARDKYGNYGIVGFYVLNKTNNILEHFLFSCRIMNMGVEQFLYSHLNKPDITIVQPVSSNLLTDCDWISLVENLELPTEVKKEKNNFNILFKGSCDLYSTISYLGGECNIDTEFPYWNKSLVYITLHTHTAFIRQTNELLQEELAKMTTVFPFPNEDEFKTEFFDKKYNVVVLSLLSDAFIGAYKNKTTGHYALFGFANTDITNENNWETVLAGIPEDFREKEKLFLENFKNEYDFMGNPCIDLTIENLKYIRENLDPNTLLILISGSEKDTDKVTQGYENIANSHAIINSEVAAFVKDYDNISLINLTDLIENDKDYTDCIDHFSRRVYIKIAKEIKNIVNKKMNKEILTLQEQELIYIS